jgi:hypothetical protein
MMDETKVRGCGRRDAWERDFERRAARDQVRNEVQSILKDWKRRRELERGAE